VEEISGLTWPTSSVWRLMCALDMANVALKYNRALRGRQIELSDAARHPGAAYPVIAITIDRFKDS